MNIKKNIFENAYFGKPYKTRDGRKAIYNYHSIGGYHDIIIDGEGMSYHFADHTNGIIRLPRPSEIDPDVDYSCPIDIVSEWTISEEELDELAYHEYPDDDDDDTPLNGIDNYELREAFKAGFRKLGCYSIT